jgi:hypothetical protein
VLQRRSAPTAMRNAKMLMKERMTEEDGEGTRGPEAAHRSRRPAAVAVDRERVDCVLVGVRLRGARPISQKSAFWGSCLSYAMSRLVNFA